MDRRSWLTILLWPLFAGSALAGPFRRRGTYTVQSAPSKKPAPAKKSLPKFFEPTDEMLKELCVPMIDACLQDTATRKRIIGQMYRVIGTNKMNRLAYLTMLDQHPELHGHPLILRRIRREMGV